MRNVNYLNLKALKTENRKAEILHILGDTIMQSPPVDGYRGHGVDAGEHRGNREEVVEPAVQFSKVPLSVSRVYEVDERVEGGH